MSVVKGIFRLHKLRGEKKSSKIDEEGKQLSLRVVVLSGEKDKTPS